MKKPTFKEFTSARLSVIQLEISCTPDAALTRAKLKLLRANERFIENALAAYQDYEDETARETV